MFNPTTEELWLEVQAAMKLTDEHVSPTADLVRRMTGRWYRKDHTTMEPDPENFGFAFVSNVLPQLGVGDPSVVVEASRVVGHKTIAQAMQDGIDAWVRDTRFTEKTEQVRLDFLISRGVMMHYLDEDQRFSRGTVTPAMKRITPARFFIDSLADDTETDEFRGHWYWKDIDDLANDPSANPEVVAKLTPGGEDATSTDSPEPAFRKADGDTLGRRRVRCYSVWLRQKNTIRVLVEGSEVMELYEEKPYYGPDTGPYVLYDAYEVPDQVWPLSPLVAVNDQVIDLNIHARAMGRAAARRKSIGLVEANNPDLGNKLADAEDGEIMPVKGITGQYVQVEVGGVTQEQFTFTEYIRNRLDRISGLTATVQGNVGGADTATEAKIADDALSNRVGYLKQKVMRATIQSLDVVGWYLFHTEGIIIPVNRRDAYTGELLEGLFFGGPWPTDMGATWDDFDIRIRLNTLQQQAMTQQNTLSFYQLFLGAMQMAPMMPWVRWMNVLRDLAESFSLPDKVDEWAIPELFGAFSQPQMTPPSMVMGPNPVPPRAGGPGGQPRLAVNNGPTFNQGFGSPENPVTRTGQVGGPRPQQAGQFAA